MPSPSHFEAANSALTKGDIERATRDLRLSLQGDPLDARAHYLLALALARAGELDEAAVGFQQTLALEPRHAAAQYNLGTVMLRRGEPVAAARLIEDSLAIDPDRVASYNNLAKAYFLTGVHELAVAGWREALRRDPSNAIAAGNLALLGEAAGGELRGPEPARSLALLARAGDGPAAATEERHPLDAEAQALLDLLVDLPHVTVERRGGRLALGGWTSGPVERTLLDRILAAHKGVLDLTTADVGDPHRLIEVDAILFKVIGLDSQTTGHNFLRRIEVNASISDRRSSAYDWIYSAAIGYEVNIANASEQLVAFLARPHLTALSGTPAKFVAGGDFIFQVSGLNSGDIKPYPFGTTLEVTPTLMRTPGPDGSPRVRLSVVAGRRTLLPILDVEGADEGSTVFENLSVASEAVIGLNQTLILTGLSQREQRTRRSGVPVLRSIPIIKYLFSEEATSTSDLAIIILLTPRDPAFRDEQNRKATAEFVRKRRDFVAATQGGPDDMRRFRGALPGLGPARPQPVRLPFLPDREQRDLPSGERRGPGERRPRVRLAGQGVPVETEVPMNARFSSRYR